MCEGRLWGIDSIYGCNFLIFNITSVMNGVLCFKMSQDVFCVHNQFKCGWNILLWEEIWWFISVKGDEKSLKLEMNDLNGTSDMKMLQEVKISRAPQHLSQPRKILIFNITIFPKNIQKMVNFSAARVKNIFSLIFWR